MIEEIEISIEDLDRAIKRLQKQIKRRKRFEAIIQSLEIKLKSGKKLTDDDITKLIEIDNFAQEHNLLELHEKVAKIIVSIEKTIPAEEVELKEGEIKKLNKDMLIRKRKNGVIEIKWK